MIVNEMSASKCSGRNAKLKTSTRTTHFGGRGSRFSGSIIVEAPPAVVRQGLSAAQCNELAQRARLCVVPVANRETASGQVTVIDSMMFGRATIATRCVGTVDYIDHGVDGATGSPYLVMPLLVGEDLETTLAREKVLEPGAAVRVVLQACRGLSLLHQGGIVHRDVKPSNLFLERSHEGIVTVRVSDFGLAKPVDPGSEPALTAMGVVVGTPDYIAPEQARGEALDGRADVFAAGILLWELCTWRRLFKRSTDLATLVAISDERAPAMSLINPEVPAELDDVVLKSLSVEPEDRYASAQEFAEALEDVLLRLDLESDNRALGQFMRELFKDKLDQQLAKAREAGFGTVEEYLLSGKAGESGEVPSPQFVVGVAQLVPEPAIVESSP